MSYSSRRPYVPARRVSYSTWMKMSPAQRNALKAKLYGRKSKMQYQYKSAPTRGFSNAQSELRTQTPLFPARVTKKIPYYEPSISMTGTGGVIQQYVFSANGVYDPNITGTGHQPLGFDTMMLYYEQYTVVESRITVTCCGNGIQAGNFAICLAPDTTSLTVEDVVENGLMVMKTIDGRGTNGTGQRIGTLNLKCNVAKYFGRKSKRDLLDTTELSGNVAANPTEQVYFVIAAWGFGSFTDNTSFSLTATIEYDVVFWEPRKVATQLRTLKEKPTEKPPKEKPTEKPAEEKSKGWF